MEKYDATYVEKVLSFFGHQEAGGVTEIRVITREPYLKIGKKRHYVGKVLSGYYTDYQKAAKDIAFLDGRANIYFLINPVKQDFFARAANRLQRAAVQRYFRNRCRIKKSTQKAR